MITSTHVVLFASDAEAARAFLTDVLELPSVDAGGGWLIFKLPPAELGVHPTGPDGGASGTHELYLMCDDIAATVAELTAKGAEFTTGVHDAGFGQVVRLRVPGGGELALYQPRHPVAYDLPAEQRPAGTG